jgi:hypothetical protein
MIYHAAVMVVSMLTEHACSITTLWRYLLLLAFVIYAQPASKLVADKGNASAFHEFVNCAQCICY